MNDYILFMVNDPADADMAENQELWRRYINALRQSGRFDGGSSIGSGIRVSKLGTVTISSSELTGFIRVRAESAEDARQFLTGNPLFEAGGTVEIRELPRE
ncbi:MAG: hypothetical protein ACK4OE_23980 [Acidovorax sp.]|uniref:hypothetical protein n=1 Tax=Acidovorax sp. TaxID=1872122 RepID=UPI00391AC7FA